MRTVEEGTKGRMIMARGEWICSEVWRTLLKVGFPGPNISVPA